MKQSRTYSGLSARRSRTALAALAVTAGLVAAVPAATTARASTARPAHGQPASVRSGTGSGLTTALAAAQAKATGKPVVASRLTTPTSQTTANPGGTFTVTESLQPARAWHNGAWATLNPALRMNADGTLSPRVTTAGLVLSGGGTSPLAVMTLQGRSLAFTWPGRLPRPTLSGPAATYRDVLPGVNLVVTATAQGGFSDVLVVKNAAAAADPRLTRLRLSTAGTGVAVTARSDGALDAAGSPSAPPVFTAAPPRMWDSARLPAAASQGSGGASTRAARTGMPLLSSANAPGAAAHITTVPVRVTPGAITMAPPAAALTGRHVSYPVYIDPTWTPASANAANWTQVDSGFPYQTYWRESSDLQSGLCPQDITSPPYSCNGLGVARSFFNLPIPSQLTGSSDIQSAYLYTTEEYAPSCTKESVRLYTTKAIFKTTTWKTQPTWSANYLYQDAAFGYPGCGYYKNDITWDVTSTIAGDAGELSNQTFGLRAADETNEYAWKKFWSGSSNLTMTVTYADPPNQPTTLSTSPGGSCQTNSATPAQIGNDSVTFNTYVSDDTPDTPLSTRFIIYNSAGTTVYDSATQNSNDSTGNDTIAQLPLSQAQMQNLQTGGGSTAYTYHWHAVTTNDDNLTGSSSQTCYFTYNPNGPPAPDIVLSASAAPLGSTVTATFTDPNCGGSSAPCPVSYTYQVGASAPVTVAADGNPGDNYQGTASIAITREGPLNPTVYATSAGGNISPVNQGDLSGTLPPSKAYLEGYFTGGSYPDLLLTGTGTDQSLWLKEGSGNGTLGTPIDIGSMGTGINEGTGGGPDDGPTDWNDAQILQGDFTGDAVQDVMAYYGSGSPHQGTAVIISGTGDSSPLQPASGSVYTIASTQLQDPGNGDDPIDLVPAGNASEIDTGTDDLIGISGAPGDIYDLDLYTSGSCSSCGSPYGYGYDTLLSSQAPDGTADWNNYSLATAELGNDPSDVALFALDNFTGKLWETTNTAESAKSIVGTGTWTKINVPWGSSPPTLLTGDINNAGQIELWTQSGGKDPSYALSGTTLSEEYAQPTSAALGQWPLTDGYMNTQGPSSTTAVNTITGTTANLQGGAAWDDQDPYFSTDISLDGESGYVLPPAATVPNSNTQPKISLWFKTTTPGGVLVSLQSSAVTSQSPISGGYDPVLYIGTDGKLYAEWWNGSADPAVSATPVDDGLWHHVTLTGYTSSQNLYVDNQSVVNVTGSVNLAGVSSGNTNLTVGTGYIGGTWPTESHYSKTSNTGYLDYFQGQIADVIYSYPGGP